MRAEVVIIEGIKQMHRNWSRTKQINREKKRGTANVAYSWSKSDTITKTFMPLRYTQRKNATATRTEVLKQYTKIEYTTKTGANMM